MEYYCTTCHKFLMYYRFDFEMLDRDQDNEDLMCINCYDRKLRYLLLSPMFDSDDMSDDESDDEMSDETK